ncbi:histidinol-phosphate transaminase [Variovorax sp. V213]|uniref:histidinol-phosphate transaminase n=1 Tax=Variovorax sp. V213 TaxID=3065955 RepID=UPI0034E8E572
MTTSSTVRPIDRIRSDVQSMHAYAVQDARGFVKLDAMENPFGLPPALQVELGARLGALALNRYPGERGGDLQRALAAHAHMPEGFGLMLGNGSDELISLLAIACDVPGATVLAPVPGFVMYAMSARLQGLRFVGVPLTADFELDEAAMLAAIAREKPAIVYLAYPNNPTANLWDDAAIEKIVRAQGEQGGLVVIDEAYQPFAAKSYIDRIARHGHVLLMRTLSKLGLAGIRLGYLMGPAALIAEIDKVRPPYNVSALNCECALFALEHAEVFEAQARQIREERHRLMMGLGRLSGVKVWPSDANMILVRVPDAAKTFEGMKTRGILVKNVSKMHELLANCLRLTVGTADENARMLAALEASL